MQTITFYSYKGGVGRTLVVANVARYLSRFRKSVFAIDFDLEAPGLLYKFALDQKQQAAPECSLGFVDYLYRFSVERKDLPSSLSDYVTEISVPEGSGQIRVMGAGPVPSQQYWKKLAAINWHELFYSFQPVGIPFFLNLKEGILNEFAPDFLLIDSRTGITEIGGVATTVLPDKVVALLINNNENLEGAREVLRTVRASDLLADKKPIEIIPVLTRIPRTERSEMEASIIRDVKEFLNEPAEPISKILTVDEVFVLHSDRDLELKESLRIGGDKLLEESELLRDYLRLFTRLIPREVIDPFILPLVNAAAARTLDEPEAVQRELEAIAATYPHPEAMKRLLQLYRLRGADSDTLLRTGMRYWEMAGESADAILWHVIKERFKGQERFQQAPGYSLEFIEAVWRSQGNCDPEVGLKLAQSYVNRSNLKRSQEIFAVLIHRPQVSGAMVSKYLDVLREGPQIITALEIIERFRSQFNEDPAFITAWGAVLLRQDSLKGIQEFLSSSGALLSKSDPIVYARLLMRVGDTERLNLLLDTLLAGAVREGPSALLEEVGSLYDSVGRYGEFEERVRQAIGSEGAEDFLRHTRRPRRRSRFG